MQGIINVTDFGAVGDGVTNDRAAIADAVAYMNEHGGTLYFPPGHYYSPYLSHTDPANWIEITKSGVKLQATPGSVKLENFLFYVHGEYGLPQLVGVAGFTTGDNTINTANAHGLQPGDYVQLFSGINAYTTDAGEWQLGSQNPTTLALPKCRFSEIHRVKTIDSATSCVLYTKVIYAGYKDNTLGQSYPMPGIDGAEVRKLYPIVGIAFSGLTFVCSANNYRSILIRCAVNVVFETCYFESNSNPGRQVITTDVDGIIFNSCISNKALDTSSGSGWNSFVVGGGSQGIAFVECKFLREAQSVDITPGIASNDVGSSANVLRADYLAAQAVSFVGCSFYDCGDGLTTHPGTYNLLVSGCVFIGVSTGIRARSKKNLIIGNSMVVTATGISLSAFYHDTLITGNNISQYILPAPRSWSAVHIVPMSSEIMNNNNIKNVVVSNNLISCVQPLNGYSNDGVLLRHAGNGVPGNPSFELFTLAVKRALSDYLIEGNTFNGCGIRCEKWINGVQVIGNSYGNGASAWSYVYFANDSARNTVSDNLFKDGVIPALRLGTVADINHGYSTLHRVGFQRMVIGSMSSSELNHVTSLTYSSNDTARFDSVGLNHGGKLAALRVGVGQSTLNIDSVPSDGTSNSIIGVFKNSPTSGTKTFSISGRLETHNAYPAAADTYTSGLSNRAWEGGYTRTAFIVTSDEREKQSIVPIDDAVLRAWAKVDFCKFKFSSAIEKKGESAARWHFGVIAQQVKEAFESEGLDAFEYGLLCYDEWEETPEILDEEGTLVQSYRPPGSRYGIRYEEALALECAYLRSRVQAGAADVSTNPENE